ncbi:hypothetical protein E1293_33125 [Actinomadura darangshiensis]|uniref:Uncharacterized protein n=1 Tax=Actinomadura darangshiensis TaxID=705336 RepID=A0A4R5AKZ2_9ACTN|nr:hypothetical protein [Actinomadura darangshiensis]TDD72119.1 hypothetical protein E1293_33125 [Actinomadura darangshiensis]
MTTQMIGQPDQLDLVTHSPDGESRGLAFRVGDIFPMDPGLDLASQTDAPATKARPWVLRFLVAPRAGKHDKGTSDYTTGGQGDNQHPEDKGKESTTRP